MEHYLNRKFPIFSYSSFISFLPSVMLYFQSFKYYMNNNNKINTNSTGRGQVDLTNFDIKFQTKFLYIRFLKLTYSC
jgi:hypothetical protein